MNPIEDKVYVKVTKQNDLLTDIVGEVVWIGGEGKVCVYFDLPPEGVRLVYNESELEVVRKS
jgi:hypothetical protein